MLHIYRQITRLERVRPIVITQKRENPAAFPFDAVHSLPKPATHFLRRFWFRQLLAQPWQISKMEVDSLLRILNRSGARLLHIYFGHIAVHLLPLIRTWPNPSVVSFHGADVLVEMNKPAYRGATQEMFRHVRRIFVRSDSLRRAVALLGADEGKIDVVRTGIPLEQFPFRARSLPRNGEWQLLQAGRLIEKKGYATTLRAFAAVLEKYPKATLILAGDGPLRADLQRLARTLKIEQRVSFRGFIPQTELRELFYESHMFLHPSQMGRDGNQEGVPNAMLEAMATGLAVFATNHGGIPEAIVNGVSGELVAERDHAALGAAVVEAMQKPETLATLARNGAESVRNEFDQRRQIRHLEDLYLAAMALPN